MKLVGSCLFYTKLGGDWVERRLTALELLVGVCSCQGPGN